MFRQQIAMNKRKTFAVVAMYLVFFVLVGGAVGRLYMDNALSGIALAVIAGLAYTLVMVANSTAIVMAMNGAREVKEKDDFPMYYNIVSDMAIVSHLPMPRMFVINDPSPNAFATGMSPEKSAVAVTTGLLERLNREELEGVIAHEFSHIKNYDIRLQTVAVALGAVLGFLSQFSLRMAYFGGGRSRRSDDREDGGGAIVLILSILLLILTPLMTAIMQMAISRNREYLADASAVELTRNPQGLISALKKISQSEPMQQVPAGSEGMYIMFPGAKGRGEERDHLFSTHPSTANRIKRLEQM
ncbi:zinc metalloprotease HtpX [Atopobacter sp. AH10]|uniref:zinc metalloprotease HtpX n=1 Tax=Atopobacter sp. AH10 TaxID=2315861 RepID=UPI000EF1A31C|nr:zinc metalloprotease HtpX [Atopobacter sp. AH10]RLK62896.1 zinc metalloprotease HtpX [Atopobacter sp. AH10]